MYNPLNEAQFEVLRWVAAGRPKGVYEEGFQHRITARALERRGLLSVRGHGRTWNATMTSGGRYYLEHGQYEPDADSNPALTSTPRRKRVPTPPVLLPIEGLVEQLREGDGALHIHDPSDVERASYKRAVEQARSTGELAPHERLKINGLKRGALIITLLKVEEAPEPAVAVPAEADPQHPAVHAANKAGTLEVSDEQKPRALALVQAIAEECRRREWVLSFDDSPGFLVSIGQESYRCTLFEEREKRDVVTDEDITARKYDWQRVSPTRMEVFAGHLRLEIGKGYSARRWADRTRWSLASKLDQFFTALDELSTSGRDHRHRIEHEHRANVAAWEQAVPRAREAYLRVLNSSRADAQVAAWQRANELRAYAEAVANSHLPNADEATQQARAEWAAWLVAEAARIDPSMAPAQLYVESPEDVNSYDLDKHMPRGWTTRHPPDPPEWLRS